MSTPAVRRINLALHPDVKDLAKQLTDEFSGRDLTLCLLADTLLGLIKASVPDFPGKIMLEPKGCILIIVVEYPRKPEEIERGGPTIHTTLGFVTSDKEYKVNKEDLAGRHYRLFNNAKACLLKFFKDIGWTVNQF